MQIAGLFLHLFAHIPQPVQRSLQGKLYLRLETMDEKRFRKIRAILKMFPGTNPVVVYFADTKKRMGSQCGLSDSMLQELKNVLGEENVVLK